MSLRKAHIKRLHAKKPDLTDKPDIYVDILRFDEYEDAQNAGAQRRTVALKWLDDDEDSANTLRETETKTITMPRGSGEVDVKAITALTTFNSGQKATRIFKNSAENTKRVVAIKRIYQTNLAIEGEIDWETFPGLWQAAQASKVESVYIDIAITKEFSTKQMQGSKYQAADAILKNNPLLDLMEDSPGGGTDVVYLDPYQIVVNIKARKSYVAIRHNIALVYDATDVEYAPVNFPRDFYTYDKGPMSSSFLTDFHYEFSSAAARIFDETTGTWASYDVSNILDTATGLPSLASAVFSAGAWVIPSGGGTLFGHDGMFTAVTANNPYLIVESDGAASQDWTYLVDGTPTLIPVPEPSTGLGYDPSKFPMYFDEALSGTMTLWWPTETGTVLNLYDSTDLWFHGTEGYSYSWTPPSPDPGHVWVASTNSGYPFTVDYSGMTWIDPDGQNYRAVSAQFVDPYDYSIYAPSVAGAWPVWVLFEPYEPDLP